jgi:hypothetical protein
MDALEQLLNEAINCGLDEQQLRLAVADAETAITEARQSLSDKDQSEIDNRESITCRARRLGTLLEETGKRRNDFIKKYYRGSFKFGLADESATWVSEDAQAQILRASITFGESLLEGLHRAKRAATLHLIESQRNWCHAQGLLEAHRAYQLFLPVLQNDPGAKIDLKASKAAAYSTKILEMEKLISEFKAREAQYGTNQS